MAKRHVRTIGLAITTEMYLFKLIILGGFIWNV